MNDNRKKFRITFAVATVLLLAITFLVISVLGNFAGARLDLTAEKQFTMSPSAKKILGELQVPVQAKVYITPEGKMPTEWKNLERNITDKLRDYERVSDGMLQYTVYNPQDDEEMQNNLSAKGIRPFQVQSVEKDQIAVKQIWSAMTLAYKDYPEETIPQVLPQSLENLEYELISRVFRLTNEEKAKIALYAPPKAPNQQMAMMYLQQGMQPPEPQPVFQSIQQLFQQEHYELLPIQLTKDSPIPDDADLLVVLNPANLNRRQAFEINRRLSNGMPAVIAVQSHTYEYSQARRGGFTFNGVEQQSGLESMLQGFGVQVGKDHFFDESLQVLSMRSQSPLGRMLNMGEPVKAPMQVLITETQMNSEAAITNRIGSLLYLWGTQLEMNESELARQDLAATVLLNSSKQSWTEPYSDGAMPGSFLVPANKQMLGPQPLAVLLEGEFPDTFTGQSVPEWPAAPPPGGDPEEEAPTGPPADSVTPLQAAPGRLVLLGSSKMFEDDAIQAGQNALLLLNAVDALAYGEDLISIRSKTFTQRVVRPTSNSEKLLFRLFTVGLVPVLLAIYWGFRVGMRRKEAALYRQQLALKSKA